MTPRASRTWTRPHWCLTVLSPLSSGHDGIDNFNDSVQSRVGADGHVGAAEVVVDGAHHAHHVEVSVLLHGFVINLACIGNKATESRNQPQLLDVSHKGQGWRHQLP